MTLREKRILGSKLIAEHLLWLNSMPSTEAAFAEGMDRKTAKDPTSDHMDGGGHDTGVAWDIDLYFHGEWQSKTEAHSVSGQRWKTRHPLCRWGGDWGDGNHYSLEHMGRK